MKQKLLTKCPLVAKFLSVMLIALLMVASFSITSSAAEPLKNDDPVSITLNCTKPGYTFEVFEVAKLDSSTASPYSTAYTSFVPEISAEILAGDTETALTKLDAINTLPSTATSQGKFVTTATSQTQTFNGLEQGIYYIKCIAYPAGVKSVQNSLIALPYYNDGWVYEYPEINLATKVADDTPTTVKTITNSTKNNVNYTDVSLGDTVSFELKNTTAGSDAIKLTSYSVFDDMSKGLTLDNNSFVVYLAKADGTKIADLKNGTDYQVNITKQKVGENTTFDVALTENYLSKSDFYASDVTYTVVTYTAKLNEYATKGIAGNPNEDIELVYGNTSGTDSVPGNTVYVYTYGIGIEKINQENEKLAGAEFKLYKTEADAKADKNAIATGTSDSNGVVDFKTGNKPISLQSGTYYAVETKAPTPYLLFGEVITIDIPVEYNTVFTNNTWVKTAPADGIKSLTVTNVKTVLPQTGGHVELLYYIGFGLIGCSAIILLVKTIKKNKNKTK